MPFHASLRTPAAGSGLSSDDLPSVLDAAQEAFVAVNAQGVISEWNLAAEAVLGFSRAEVLGRSLVELVVPKRLRPAYEDALRRHAGDHGALAGRRLELPARHRDGHEVPLEGTLSAVRIGGRPGVAAFLRERAPSTEAPLDAADPHFAGAFDAAAIGMALVAPDGRWLAVNQGLCELLGRSEDELLALDFQGVTHPDDLRADLEHVSRVLSGEISSYTLAKRYLRPDGGLVWAQLAVSLVRDAEGRPLHFVSQVHDITDRKTAELELQRYAEQLAALCEREPERDAPPETPTGARVDEILDLARTQFGMDLAFMTEISGEQLTFRGLAGDAASFGLEVGDSIPLEEAYCAYMADGRIPNVVGDVPADATVGGLAVTEAAGVGAYAGVPLRTRDGRLRGTLCVLNHATRPDLDSRASELLGFLANVISDQIAHDEREALTRQERTALAGVRALLGALEARDFYTGEHSRTVVALATGVAARLGLDPEQTTLVEQAALLHDVGKIGIPDTILRKQGPLDEHEWRLMRQHPVIGERIVAGTTGLAHLAPAVRAEHERWDGAGYPDGLAGEAIPLASRITLACDAYHAMTSDRPYRPGMPPQRAREELARCAGTQFDPDVVAALLAVLDETAS